MNLATSHRVPGGGKGGRGGGGRGLAMSLKLSKISLKKSEISFLAMKKQIHVTVSVGRSVGWLVHLHLAFWQNRLDKNKENRYFRLHQCNHAIMQSCHHEIMQSCHQCNQCIRTHHWPYGPRLSTNDFF